MKLFDCNPEWPICLYDFSFKNSTEQYQAFKAKYPLSHYARDNYIIPVAAENKKYSLFRRKKTI